MLAAPALVRRYLLPYEVVIKPTTYIKKCTEVYLFFIRGNEFLVTVLLVRGGARTDHQQVSELLIAAMQDKNG